MRRREFFALLGGAAAAWPLAARAQRSGCGASACSRAAPADDPEAQARFMVFLQALQQLGWIVGRNVRIDARWGGGDADRIRKHAAELVALAPDVILAAGGAILAPLLQTTRTVPIVFAYVPDPVGSGFVNSLARPGGNATGFTLFEYSLSGEMVGTAQRDCAGRDASGGPSGSRLCRRHRPVCRHPGRGAFVRDGGHPDQRARRARNRARRHGFCAHSNGGLIVTASALAVVHRDLIIALAARHRLPAVYSVRFFVAGGGLISYGRRSTRIRRAAGYVDRILKGREASRPAGAGADQVRIW